MTDQAGGAFARGIVTLAGMLFGLALPLPGATQSAKPQYGGTLTVGAYHMSVAPMSRDPSAWSWMFQHNNGLVYEQLFTANLDKSRGHGGPYPFTADAWLPSDAIRGELAESWAWKDDPLRVEVTLRKGVMFADKPGVMKARELVAQDVVDTFETLDRSAKKAARFFDHIIKVEAAGDHVVVFRMKSYNAEWDYRFGWGLYCGIVPREVIAAGAADWKNANGTGPFLLTDVVQGNTTVFTRNAAYWGRERIGGDAYALPFVERIVYPTIKDEATVLAALRTGRIDIVESIRASAIDQLKKSAPDLIFSRSLGLAQHIVLRVDTRPFDDLRVRRAVNFAVNKREIVQAYYRDNAELFASPIHPDFVGYFEPLDKMPAAARELFTYDPDKARALLAEAGYSDGFRFTVQVCSCSPNLVDLAPLIAAYLGKIGVTMEIQTLDYPALFSARQNRTHTAGAFAGGTYGPPTTAVRRYYVTGQPFNHAGYSNPEVDRRMAIALEERDETKRQALIREMTRDIVQDAPAIWLPVPYIYTAWWPWVKNYGGELRAGAERPGPIHARIWIDQELKKKMGH